MKRKRIAGIATSFILCLTLMIGMLSGTGDRVKADGINEESDGKIYVGDVDGDEKITVKDVTIMRRALAGGWGADVTIADGDVDQDGSITPKDVTMLRRYLVGGWGVTLPEKKPQYESELDALVNVGGIVFPCNRMWDYYLSVDSDNGTQDVSFYTDDDIIIMYKVTELSVEESSEKLSSKEAFMEIGQKYLEGSTEDDIAGFKQDIIEEGNTWYCRVIIDFYYEDDIATIVTGYRIIGNNLVEIYVLDAEGLWRFDDLAMQICKSARLLSESDAECGFIDSASDHSWIEIERQEATETENGYVKYICENCGEIKTKVLYATNLSAGMYYQVGNGEVYISWADLIKNGYITVEDNVITAVDYTKIKGRLVIQNGITGITAGFAKSYSTNTSQLTSVYIPESVSIMGNSNSPNPFSDCSMLEEIMVDPLNKYYDSRDNCNAIVLSSTNTIISGCKNTTFPASVENIGEEAFAGANLVTVVIPGTIKKLKSSAFRTSYNLKTVILSEGLEYIGSGAFNSDYNITEIKIPSTVTYIGALAFGSITKLQKLTVSKQNTLYTSGDNDSYVFEKASGRLIASLDYYILDGTKVIETGALMVGSFTNDENADLLTIPASVEKISYSGLSYINFKHIRFLGAPPVIQGSNFVYYVNGKEELIPGLIDIVVPTEYLDAYKELLPQLADKIIPDCEHNWVEVDRKEANIDEDGYIKYECSKCGGIKTEVIEFVLEPGIDDVPITEHFFPDETFRNFIKTNYDTDGDSILSVAEAGEVVEMHVWNMGINSVKGVEYFTNLWFFDCAGNNLTGVDISKNQALRLFSCSINPITNIDVSSNPDLTRLDCGQTKISSIDISNNINLTELYCANNALKTLDVSNNTALKSLNCSNNSLTSLDISNNPDLTYLDCNVNNLTELIVSNNTALQTLNCGWNNLTSLDVKALSELERLECPNNQVSAIDLTGNPKLNNLGLNNNKLTSLDVSQNSNLFYLDIRHNKELKEIDISNNPNIRYFLYDNGLSVKGKLNIDYIFNDDVFKGYLREYFDTNADNYLDQDEIALVKEIDVSGTQVGSLDGIEIFKNLEKIDCSNTSISWLNANELSLKEIYAGNNAYIGHIDCWNNQLTVLDVTNTPALTSIICYNNKLSELNVSTSVALRELRCFGNTLTNLDLSHNPNLNANNVSRDTGVNITWYNG